MGQKVVPIGIRNGINRTSDSRWFAGKKTYASQLLEDLNVKKFVKTSFKQAGIANIKIERPSNKVVVSIRCARPGVLIGKAGKDIENAKRKLSQICANRDVELNIVEVKKPELDAQLVAENIAGQLERRASFRKCMKRAVQGTLRMGGLGIRINCAGRLAGAEIARTEWYREGRVPLHTLRADISYGTAEAHTTYGIIGVKVWIFKGEVIGKDPYAQDIKDSSRRNQKVGE